MADRVLNVLLTGDSAGLQRTFKSAVSGAAGAKAAMAGIVIGGAAAAKALYDIGAEFDAGYDKIRTGTGATGQHLKGLESTARNAFKHLPADFDEVSEAVADLNTRLGVNGKYNRKLTEQFVELSRFTGTDLSGNIEAVSQAFEDAEVPVRKQSQSLDYLFRASQASGASVEDLAKMMKEFGSPLRQLGINFKESAAMFAEFEKTGVNIQTMVPGLKFALKTFIAEGKNPAKALKETFKGIQDGSITATEALKLFGQRAGADMVEAIHQSRFNFAGFQRQLESGSDTILKAGNETKDAGERFKEFGNRLKVLVEPAATAVFEAVGQFSAELTTLDFKSPISGAVAFSTAVVGIVGAFAAVRAALSATTVLIAANPWVAAAVGVAALGGAIYALTRKTSHTVPVFKQAKDSLHEYAAASKRLHNAQREVKSATEAQRKAEHHLQEVIKKHGPNSVQAIEAEAAYKQSIQQTNHAIKHQRDLERVSGVERKALFAALRVDVARLSRQQAQAVAVEKAQREGLRGVWELYKHHEATLGDVRRRVHQLGEAEEATQRKTKRLNEVIAESASTIGPKYAKGLEHISDRTRTLTKQTQSFADRIKGVPSQKVIDYIVHLKLGGGLNLGSPGGGGGRKGGSGDGWGKVEKRAEDRARAKVRKEVDKNPMAAMMAATGQGLLGLGGGGIGAHVPGAWRAFIPYAHHFGLQLSSGYRPGAITSSGNPSYHSMNRAGDFSNGTSTPQEYAFGMFMARRFGAVLKELIHTPLGFSIKDGRKVPPYAAAEHYDHVHVAYQEGGKRSHKQTAPTILYGEEAPRYPEYFISTNPRDRKRSLGLVSELLGEITAFKSGGKLAAWVHGSGTLDADQLASLAHYVGMPNPGLMAQIAEAESGGNPHSMGGAGDKGLWQIIPSTAQAFGIDYGSLFDPLANARGAAKVLAGQGLTAWSTFNNGAYKSQSKGHVSPLGAAGGAGSGSGGGLTQEQKERRKVHKGRTGKGGGTEGPYGQKRKGEKSPTDPARVSLPGLGTPKVPKVLRGLPQPIQNLFRSPGLTPEGRFEAAELALGIAEETAGNEDNEAIFKFQLGASKTRKRKIQEQIHRVNKRLGGRMSEAQRKQLLGKRANLYQQLGTAQGRIGSARQGLAGLAEEGEAEPAESELEHWQKVGQLQLAQAQRTTGKQDDLEALQSLKGLAEQQLKHAEESGDLTSITEATSNLKQATNDLRDATVAAFEEENEAQLALAELTEGVGDDIEALTKNLSFAEGKLVEAQAEGNNAEIARWARTVKQDRDAIKGLQNAQEESSSELKALREAIEQQTAITESAMGTSAAVAWRALADVISGQLGAKTNHNAQTVSNGSVGAF